MSTKLICTVVLTSTLAFAVERGEEIKLWPQGAPGSEGETAAEVSKPSTAYPKLAASFTVTHYPSVYVFLPPKENANGMAMVVAPGGGHAQLVMEKEGYEIAEWLNKRGIAAFVLKYRLAKGAGVTRYTITGHELADAARAVRLVRSRSKEWGVNPARIGVMGFSAGGEVAALIETRFDKGNDSSPDPIERVSSRPDFAVLIYPGASSGAFTVPKDAPPTFIVCTFEDRSHVVTALNLYRDLEKQEAPSELHIYSSGKHGYAMRETKLPVKAWPELMAQWLVDQKLMNER